MKRPAPSPLPAAPHPLPPSPPPPRPSLAAALHPPPTRRGRVPFNSPNRGGFDGPNWGSFNSPNRGGFDGPNWGSFNNPRGPRGTFGFGTRTLGYTERDPSRAMGGGRAILRLPIDLEDEAVQPAEIMNTIAGWMENLSNAITDTLEEPRLGEAVLLLRHLSRQNAVLAHDLRILADRVEQPATQL